MKFVVGFVLGMAAMFGIWTYDNYRTNMERR
jgi:hypothetical protein